MWAYYDFTPPWWVIGLLALGGLIFVMAGLTVLMMLVNALDAMRKNRRQK